VKNKSRTEIVVQILEVAKKGCADGQKERHDGGVNLTELKDKLFLGDAQLQEYLVLLTEGDLLYYDSNTQTFKITEKGVIFLQCYDRIDKELKEHDI
jgi:predicted transcriptional regulator